MDTIDNMESQQTVHLYIYIRHLTSTIIYHVVHLHAFSWCNCNCSSIRSAILFFTPMADHPVHSQGPAVHSRHLDDEGKEVILHASLRDIMSDEKTQTEIQGDTFTPPVCFTCQFCCQESMNVLIAPWIQSNAHILGTDKSKFVCKEYPMTHLLGTIQTRSCR